MLVVIPAKAISDSGSWFEPSHTRKGAEKCECNPPTTVQWQVALEHRYHSLHSLVHINEPTVPRHVGAHKPCRRAQHFSYAGTGNERIALMSLTVSGVNLVPGCSRPTVMPLSARSIESDFVIWLTAALLARYLKSEHKTIAPEPPVCKTFYLKRFKVTYAYEPPLLLSASDPILEVRLTNTEPD